MPIRPENKARYPKDWALRRRFILQRANNRCEHCGVRNYSVGYWIGDHWQRPYGNGPLCAAGDGLRFSSLDPLTYAEAAEIRDNANTWREQPPLYIVIVLTIAHIHDHRPEAASLLNLAALCQRCHNRHDAKMRRHNRQINRQPTNQMELAYD